MENQIELNRTRKARILTRKVLQDWLKLLLVSPVHKDNFQKSFIELFLYLEKDTFDQRYLGYSLLEAYSLGFGIKVSSKLGNEILLRSQKNQGLGHENFKFLVDNFCKGIIAGKAKRPVS